MILLLRRSGVLALLIGAFFLASSLLARSPHALTLDLWIEGSRQAIDSPQTLSDSPIVLTTAQHQLIISVAQMGQAYAPEDVLWLTVALYTRDSENSEWLLLTDTLLSARVGKAQVFSLAGSETQVSKRNAQVYLELTARQP